MIRVVILALTLLLLAACGHSVKIDENLETIPKDIALNYLRYEGVKYASDGMCIYTHDGINGIPYSELEYIIGDDGNSSIDVWRLGEAKQQFFNVDVISIVCSPVWVEAFGSGLPPEEVEEAMNKSAAALSSLGVRRVN